MVRDANRLKLVFPEVSELLETHRSVEAWIDRANIAIRSRISLTEVKALLEAGDEMPVDLSDLLEKLRARVSLAEEWLDRFKQVVPCPDPLPTTDTHPSDNIMLLWMARMRDALFDGNYSVLHDLASEGSRIPVEVDIVKLLQIELDAKSWTMKARKWIPTLAKDDNITCKRGKLEDLREHMEKAAVLREKLDLPAAIKDVWVLEGEKEIRSIVQAADDWFEKVRACACTLLRIFLKRTYLLTILLKRLHHSTNPTWTGIIVEVRAEVVYLWTSYGLSWMRGLPSTPTLGALPGKCREYWRKPRDG